MTKEELEESCLDPKNRKAKILNWTAEVYGRGKIYREYGFYPKKWSLYIYSSHGVTLRDTPAKHEIENEFPFILYFSKRLTRLFNNEKGAISKAVTVLEPFVFYRRKNKIKKNPNAKGTIVFVGHTTPRIDDVGNVTDYISQLHELPEKFKPLTVCLHFHDINKGMHIDYLKSGFDVVTMGNSLNDDYIPEFYKLLSQFRFSCSNLIGSYVHYAVEMGISFFYYGNPPKFYNKSDENHELGSFTSLHSFKKVMEAKELFNVPDLEVTKKQMNFVEEQLGVHDSISRLRFSFILYWSYFLYLGKKYLYRIKKMIYKSLNLNY